MRRFRLPAAVQIIPLLTLAACHSSGDDASLPGDRDDDRPYAGIGKQETVRFVGTEPFWGGRIAGSTLTYETPEQPEGETVAAERFAGRGGVSWSGGLGEAAFTMTVTPAECSDGMSDRTYPFVATLQLGDKLLSGCAWTDTQPFQGPAAP